MHFRLLLMIVSERIVQYRLNIFQITITFRILDAWQMDCTFFLGPTHLWPRKILILRCCLDLKSLMRDLRARVKEILVNLCYKTEGSFGWISNGGRLLKTDLTSEFSVAKIWSTDERLKMLSSSPFLLCVTSKDGEMLILHPSESNVLLQGTGNVRKTIFSIHLV